MKTIENTKSIVRLQEQYKHIIKSLNSISKTLEEITQSISSIRNDVNQANTKAINNKIEIERQKQELSKIEQEVLKNTNFRQNFSSNVSLVKWFASFIGFSNLVLIIFLFAQFTGMI